MPAEPLLRLVLAGTATALALVVLLLVLILALHAWIDRRQRGERALAESWRPLFLHAIEGLPCVPPLVPPRRSETVLLTWLSFVESVRGEARERLVHLGRDLQFAARARHLLRRRPLRSRLVGLAALGHLGVAGEDDRRVLLALLAERHPLLSVVAARSLLQLDPARNGSAVVAATLGREDWPMRKVAAMLGEVPAATLSAALLGALESASPIVLPRLLGLLEAVPLDAGGELLNRFLTPEQPVEILAAALRACRHPDTLPAMRRLAAHPSWVVRAQVAAAIGRLGATADQAALYTMLGDRQWWVRYRAARALLDLPGVSRAEIAERCRHLVDPFAADALRHALAETGSPPAT